MHQLNFFINPVRDVGFSACCHVLIVSAITLHRNVSYQSRGVCDRSWSRELVEKFPAVVETEGSFLCSQQPAIGPHSESHIFSPHRTVFP